MIKKIIFDIDNTIIDFPKNYKVNFESILQKHGSNLSGTDLYNAIGNYEKYKTNIYYDKDRLLEIINKELNTNFTIEIINDFFKMYDKLITPVSDEVKDTLEYLSSKYEIVAYTNWFTDTQISRLNEAGILHYFKEVYGGDKIPLKPRKEGFMKVINGLNLSECVMIGDNLEVDIKVPYEMGMNVFHLNKFGTSKYPTIKKIEELKERL